MKDIHRIPGQKCCVLLRSPTLPIFALGARFLTIENSFWLLNFTFQDYKHAAGKICEQRHW